MAVDLNDPKMAGYIPLETFINGDADHPSDIRDVDAVRFSQALTITPLSLDFGEVGLSIGSYAQTVTLTNSGFEPVTLSSVKVVGAFELVGTAPTTIAPNETAALQLQFKPTRLGAVTGGVYLDSGDAAGQEFVELRGVGVTGLGGPTPGSPGYALEQPGRLFGADGSQAGDVAAVTAMLADAAPKLYTPAYLNGCIDAASLYTHPDTVSFLPVLQAWCLSPESRGKWLRFNRKRAWWAGTTRPPSYSIGGGSSAYLPLPDGSIWEWDREWDFRDWPQASAPTYLGANAEMGPAIAVSGNVNRYQDEFTVPSGHDFKAGDRIRIIATANLNNAAGSFLGKTGGGFIHYARSFDLMVRKVTATTVITYDGARDFIDALALPVMQKYLNEPRNVRLVNPSATGPGRSAGSANGSDRFIGVIGGRNLQIDGGTIAQFGGAFVRLGSIMGGHMQDTQCLGTDDFDDIGRALFYGGQMSDFTFQNVTVYGGGQAFMHSGLGGDLTQASIGISRDIKHIDCAAYGYGNGGFTQHPTGEGLSYYRCKSIGSAVADWGYDIRTPNCRLTECEAEGPAATAMRITENINGLRVHKFRAQHCLGGIRMTTFNPNDSWVTPPGDIEITHSTLTDIGGSGSPGGLQIVYPLLDGGVQALLGRLLVESVFVQMNDNTRPFQFGGRWDSPVLRNLESFGNSYGMFSAAANAKDWKTNTNYNNGDAVDTGSGYYNCIVAHKSGDFAIDLAAGKWVQLTGPVNLTMENHRSNQSERWTIRDDTGQRVIINPVKVGVTGTDPLHLTADTVLENAHIGMTLTNAGASGPLTHTLPGASSGRELTFFVLAAQPITLRATTNDRFRIGKGAEGAVNGSLTIAGNVGGFVRLRGTTSSSWNVILTHNAADITLGS